MFWSRARGALVACALASALALLHVGLFQIRAVRTLACPLFAGGCASVAAADFAWPLGLPDGLLWSAVSVLVLTCAQVRGRAGPALLGGAVFLQLAVAVWNLASMARFGAWCSWRAAAALLAAASVLLWLRCSREAARAA